MKNSIIWLLLLIIPLILVFASALIRLQGGDGTWGFVLSLVSFSTGLTLWLMRKLNSTQKPH